MAYLLGVFIGGFIFYLIPALITWKKDRKLRNNLLFLAVIINLIYVPLSINPDAQYISLIYLALWVVLGLIAIKTSRKNYENYENYENNECELAEKENGQYSGFNDSNNVEYEKEKQTDIQAKNKSGNTGINRLCFVIGALLACIACLDIEYPRDTLFRSIICGCPRCSCDLLDEPNVLRVIIVFVLPFLVAKIVKFIVAGFKKDKSIHQ